MRLKLTATALLIWSATFNAQNKPGDVDRDIAAFAENLDVHPESSRYYLDRALKTSAVIGNDSLTSRVLCNFGYYYYVQGNLPESKIKYGQAIALAKKTGYHKILSSCYNQLGTIASDNDRFDDALKWYLMALKITDNNPLPEIRSRVLINLGNLYLIEKDTLKSIGYYNANIANAKKYSLQNELAKGYVLVALQYAKKDLKKSSEFYKSALLIAQKNKDWYTEFWIRINLSDLYLSDANNGNLEKVFQHLQNASKIQRLLRDESLLFYIHFNYGGYYLNNKNYTEALSHYNDALTLSQKKSITSDQKLNLYKAIAALYICKNDYRSALIFKDRYNAMKDSIFDIEKHNSFNEIETKYGVDKKNLKIKLLTKDQEIEKNKKTAIVVVGMILLGLLTIALFFLRHRIKAQRIIRLNENKIHRQEIVRLEQEQELKRVVGILEGQSAERNRIASEIHDGIGGELAGIKLYLSKINSSLNDSEISWVIQKLTGLFQELRNISHNLSSNFLKDRDFDTVLMEMKTEYERSNGIHLEIIIYPENTFKSFSEAFTHELYRIIQELLANASKHAKAQKVALTITNHNDFLNIIVEDDGTGFKKSIHSGIGMANIKNRLTSLGGTMQVESVENEGSTIIMDIPIKR